MSESHDKDMWTWDTMLFKWFITKREESSVGALSLSLSLSDVAMISPPPSSSTEDDVFARIRP